MAVSDFRKEPDTIGEWFKQYKWFYLASGGAILVLFGVWLGGHLFAGDSGYSTNLYTEALSVAVTVLVLNTLARRRADKQRLEELKLQMGSPVNGFAVEAARILRQTDWWHDGSLQGAILLEANLQEAKLQEANLQGANLWGANLQEVCWFHKNLKGLVTDTVLPDGTQWTPDRDMREFTHPEEWKAEQGAQRQIDVSSAETDSL